MNEPEPEFDFKAGEGYNELVYVSGVLGLMTLAGGAYWLFNLLRSL